eukprot:TRINITY_DN1371_c0_g1_i1.p1 TRINITY_DN1371_c0_g1~~TRINITY_DN1371_c0_g1_i1.p1  ORF type:complete len:589 (+),score=270.75 TRINITY_DN1371_c0_g1_i1:62-1828(+)
MLSDETETDTETEVKDVSSSDSSDSSESNSSSDSGAKKFCWDRDGPGVTDDDSEESNSSEDSPFGHGGFGFGHSNFHHGDPRRQDLIMQLSTLNSRLAQFRQGIAQLRNIERLNDLGFEIARGDICLSKLESEVDSAVSRHEITKVQEVLLQKYNQCAIDRFDLTTLRGLGEERTAEEHRQKQLQKELVLEQVANKERFLEVEFQKKYALELAKETSRDIERKYMRLQMEYLKEEITSQKRLFLRISRARSGDMTKDEDDLKRERELKAKWDRMDRDYLAKMREVKKVIEDAKEAVRLPPKPVEKKRTLADDSSPTPEKKRRTGPDSSVGSKVPSKEEEKKIEERHKELTSQMYGLSEKVDLFIWNHLKSPAWQKLLLSEAQQPYFRFLNNWLLKQRNSTTVYPPLEQVFTCFNLTPLEKVKVVIIGQDPYHGFGQANGLAFSVNSGVRVPPSLKNIYKEMKSDLGRTWVEPKHGDLTKWAQQGVLLLNACLTVEADKPQSHMASGWQNFTDMVIKSLNERKERVVFVLWGNFAKKKGRMINKKKHVVIESAHPSPLSFHLFKGSKPFSKVNAGLANIGKSPIDWKLA